MSAKGTTEAGGEGGGRWQAGDPKLIRAHILIRAASESIRAKQIDSDVSVNSGKELDSGAQQSIRAANSDSGNRASVANRAFGHWNLIRAIGQIWVSGQSGAGC